MGKPSSLNAAPKNSIPNFSITNQKDEDLWEVPSNADKR
jgi:hypothetical protein